MPDGTRMAPKVHLRASTRLRRTSGQAHPPSQINHLCRAQRFQHMRIPSFSTAPPVDTRFPQVVGGEVLAGTRPPSRPSGPEIGIRVRRPAASACAAACRDVGGPKSGAGGWAEEMAEPGTESATKPETGAATEPGTEAATKPGTGATTVLGIGAATRATTVLGARSATGLGTGATTEPAKGAATQPNASTPHFSTPILPTRALPTPSWSTPAASTPGTTTTRGGPTIGFGTASPPATTTPNTANPPPLPPHPHHPVLPPPVYYFSPSKSGGPHVSLRHRFPESSAASTPPQGRGESTAGCG